MISTSGLRIVTTFCLTAGIHTTSWRRGTFSLSPFLVPSLCSCLTITMSSSSSSHASDDGVGQADIGKMMATDHHNKTDPAEGKSWRQLLEVSSAKSRKIRGSNYVQLATVDPDSNNEPRCRCVVFRGFVNMKLLPEDHPCYCVCDDLPCVMRMITDKRSNKVKQARKQHPSSQSVAELLWWFPKTSEQYRIRGKLVFVGGGGDDDSFEYDRDPILRSQRKEQWGNLSDSARESFFTQQTPGEPYQEKQDEMMDIPSGGRDAEGKLLPPPDTYLLMLLVPEHCDYLRLTNMYRQIDAKVEGRWLSKRVNP